MDQAVQIVVSEIESLERRVRAFSEFASEPEVHPEVLDINAVVSERVALLRPVHPGVTYQLRLDDGASTRACGAGHGQRYPDQPPAECGEAAGPDGAVIVLTREEGERVLIDVHDSRSRRARRSPLRCSSPTITFKKHGMGLGLSIAKKNALLSGGDVTVIPGDLAAPRSGVSLPS